MQQRHENKEKPQDDLPPTEGSEAEHRGKNKITSENLNRTGNKQSQAQWPNWIMAIASIVLVVVTSLYTDYARQQTHLTREGLDATRDTLNENTRQFFDTLQEMREQTVAAKTAADASKEAASAMTKSANATERQVEMAAQQMEVMRGQIEDARDALRLDQRAWLGYHQYVVQARANDAATWTNREPKPGEQFRVRFFIHNVGKTPAFKVQPMLIRPTMIPIGDLPDEPEAWVSGPNRSVIFPNDDGRSHNTRALTMSDQQFSEYSNVEKEIFFWAKLYYCDITGRRHWTQSGVAHRFGFAEFSIRSSSVSPDPGDADHPDCQTADENKEKPQDDLPPTEGSEAETRRG